MKNQFNNTLIYFIEKFAVDIWTSLISVDRLDLQVVIVYVGVICTRAQGT